MKKLFATLVVVSMVLAAAPSVLACDEDEVMTTYNGKPLDWYDQKYYEVISIKNGVILGEDQTDLKRYKIPSKHLDKDVKLKKGDYIAVFHDPNTKKIVVIFELDMD